MSEPIKLSSPQTKEFWEIPVLYEDEYLMALDKPAGLLLSPDPFVPQRPSLMKLLHGGIVEGKLWAISRKLAYLSPAHRLDAEASGVILLARSKEILIALANLFGAALVKTKYVALAEGASQADTFEVDLKLAPHPAMAGRMRIDRKRGKKSRTCFTVLETFRGWTLLRCEPFPDRTHQIRVHLRSVSLPVVADELYGGKPLRLSKLKPGFRSKQHESERPLVSHLALHAEELAFEHPIAKRAVTVHSPWPKELQVALKYLRRYAV